MGSVPRNPNICVSSTSKYLRRSIMSSKSFIVGTGVIALLTMSQIAGAHPGHGLQSGFSAGVRHPFSGIDHITAMIAVGLCAAQLGGKATWGLPATFLALMIAGGALAMGGGYVPMVEQGIAASVLVLGLVVASGSKLAFPLTAGLVGLFALFHGYAHGAEMHAGLGPLTYAMGFVVATSILLSIGVATGLVLKRQSLALGTRIAGAAIALVGLMLFWS
jgi:urease accessory protein